MNSSASSCGMFRRSAIPNAGQAVDDPEVDHLRLRAHAGSISPGATLKIVAAVSVCTSPPRAKMSRSACSPEMCARIRSSTCE